MPASRWRQRDRPRHAAGGAIGAAGDLGVQLQRLYGPRLRNSSGFQVQNCETLS
jgi:hypothetical protein